MNRRVLLVDDHAGFLGSLRGLLGSRYEVLTASSGVQALATCQAHGPFALVVSDFAMPGMTGVELLAELAERWPDTTRILLTGCADLGLAQEALERGAIFRYLTKPPQPPQLLADVAAGVERFQTAERERLLTEQLTFARESLRTLVQTLDTRLGHALGRLDALADGTEQLARLHSPEAVLAQATAVVRGLVGDGVAEVRLAPRADALEIVAREPLGPDERRALSVLAGSARCALGGALRRECAREVQEATLVALTRMARERDDETGEHLARMGAHARLMGHGLRAAGLHADVLDDRLLEDLARAAPLHDIGKVAIPDAILFKPGKLDEREWDVMRTHTTIGAEILRSVHAPDERQPLLELAREIAWTHHERWDGSGYPRGLAGAAIPLSGRIVALVDCYDALRSVRPYKHAWPHREAAAHVAEQRGRAFDPEVVDVFLAHEHEFDAIVSGVAAAAPA
jgi:response regulator RpfG family c-di-GMP phosphodiesterase